MQIKLEEKMAEKPEKLKKQPIKKHSLTD